MADNQDPLAALQQLLDQQKSAAGTPADPNGVGEVGALDPAAAPTEPPAPTGPSAEEIAALQAQRAAEDQQKIQEHLSRMQVELKDTPQYQARLSQKEASEAEQNQKALEERSKRIFQLKHLD